MVLRYEGGEEKPEKEELPEGWERIVASVDGVELPGEDEEDLREMEEVCMEVSDEKLKVEWLHRTGEIVFRARDMDCRAVERRLERALEDHFDRETHVTCREPEEGADLTGPG